MVTPWLLIGWNLLFFNPWISCLYHPQMSMCLNMNGYSCEGFDDFIITRKNLFYTTQHTWGIELQKLHLNELKQSSHNLHEWNKNIRNCSIMVFQMLEFFKTVLPIFPPKHTNCTISYALRSSNHMTCDIIIPIMGSNIQNILVFYERK